MNVLFISPGFPQEMPPFTRALAEVGAKVYGIGDTPQAGLPEGVREALSGYLRVENLWREEETVRKVREWVGHTTMDRVECLWEPGMMLAGRLRDALGVPGLSAEAS